MRAPWKAKVFHPASVCILGIFSSELFPLVFFSSEFLEKYSLKLIGSVPLRHSHRQSTELDVKFIKLVG